MISSETADKRCAIWPLISVILVYVFIKLCPLKERLSQHIKRIPKIITFPKISTFHQNKHISLNKHTFLTHKNVLIMSGHRMFTQPIQANLHQSGREYFRLGAESYLSLERVGRKEKNSVSTFGRFCLWTSLESSPVRETLYTYY